MIRVRISKSENLYSALDWISNNFDPGSKKLNDFHVYTNLSTARNNIKILKKSYIIKWIYIFDRKDNYKLYTFYFFNRHKDIAMRFKLMGF